MKEIIIKRLATIVAALDKVSVSGRQNCATISGCIGALEEILNYLNGCEITSDVTEGQSEK